MRAAELDVLQDGNPYFIRHNVFVVNGPTVVSGSLDFSQNANEENDENLLIVDDRALAQAFTTEFELVYAQAKNLAAK